MSILKNWKKDRQARIDAAKQRVSGQHKSNVKMIMSGLNVQMDPSKVSPQAKQFLEFVSKMLEEHGVTDKGKRDQCCFDLFEVMMTQFEKMIRFGGAAEDKGLNAMADALRKAGINSDPEIEEIVLRFFVEFKRVGSL